jgi:hypothetical protein
MKFQVALLTGLLISGSAFAQGADRTPSGGLDHGASNTPSDTRRTGDANENGERLICRSIMTSSTSRMAARRVCRTAEQWREAQRADD